MNEKSSNKSKVFQYPWQKSYPEGVNWDKTYQGTPHFQLLDKSVETYGDQVCSYFLGKELLYSDIGEMSNKIARGLQDLGIVKGDKVGLLLPNTPTYIAFYFGILKAGGVVVNYNPLYTTEELDFQVKNSETKLMVTLDLELLFSKCEELTETGVLDRTIIASFTKLLPPLKSFAFKLFKSSQIAKISRSHVASSCIFEENLLDNAGDPAPVDINPDVDLAVLQYTGGTTGRPKGAQLTHTNISVQTQQILDACLTLQPGNEVIMGILPFFHVFAMTVVLNVGIGLGGRLVLIPKFELKDALKIMIKQRPTMLPGVPTLYNAISSHKPPPYDAVDTLRLCISGGAPLPLEVMERFKKISPGVLIEGYGLSETSPVLTCNPPTGVIKPGSIGVPIPGTVISIRSVEDPTIEMPQGEKGEICATGPQVMSGYWNAPEETSEVFVGEFFRTGDVGYMDEDGYTFIVDRLKDLILCSGFNVYPRRIEDAIYHLSEVEEVTVVGIPDEYRGEAPKAFIKLKEGESLTVDQVKDFLKEKLSKIEQPEEIEFREELPKTMIGKLSKKELRDS